MRKAIKAGIVRWLDKILMLHDTPHSIALGTAVGIFVSLTPTIGFHMMLVILLSLFIRFNRTAGCASVWLNNPFTIPPLFFISYVVGAWILCIDPMGWREFYKLFCDAFVYDTWWKNSLAVALAMGKLTIKVAGPLWLGCLVVGIVTCTPIYFAMRALATKYQARRRAHHKQHGEPPKNLADGASDGKAL